MIYSHFNFTFFLNKSEKCFTDPNYLRVSVHQTFLSLMSVRRVVLINVDVQ